MLHAERKVCENGSTCRRDRRARRVRLPHAALPHRRSRHTSKCSGSRAAASKDTPAGEVDFTVYGWGLTAIYTSGPVGVAARRSHVLARLSGASSRSGPCCARSGTDYNVYFSNDRLFIYALGYPRPNLFDHFVRLAELTTLAAVGYVLILVGDAVFSRLARRAAADRSRAAARDPRQLLPQALSRVRARVDRAGPDARAGHPHLLRGPAAGRHSRRGVAHGGGRASASSRNPTPCCAAAHRASRRTTTT